MDADETDATGGSEQLAPMTDSFVEYAGLLALCADNPDDFAAYRELAAWLLRYAHYPHGRQMHDGLEWCIRHGRYPQRVAIPGEPRGVVGDKATGDTYWLWTYAGPGLADVPGVPAGAKRPDAPCRVPEGCYPNCPEYELFARFESAIRRASDFHAPEAPARVQ